MKYYSISVIIPVFNAERFLSKCIESLINQSLKSIELIFINDGSSDDSLMLLEKYKAIDSRIKIYNQINKGVSAARNLGIKKAKGEYLSFIDADDWVELDMYESMYKKAKEEKYDCIISNIIVDNNENRSICKFDIGNYYDSFEEIKSCLIKELLNNSEFNSMANKIYKREIIAKNKIFLDEKLRYAEDWLFNMNFLVNSKKIFYINKSFYHYVRGHESSTAIYKHDDFDKCGIWIYLKKKEYSKKFNLIWEGQVELIKVAIHCLINECISNDICLKLRIKNIKKILDNKELIEAINTYSGKKKIFFYLIKYKSVLGIIVYSYLAKLIKY